MICACALAAALAAGSSELSIEVLLAPGDAVGELGLVTRVGTFDAARGGGWIATVCLDAPLTVEALVQDGVPIAAFNAPTSVPGITYFFAGPPALSDNGSAAWPSLVEPFFIYGAALFIDGELTLLGTTAPTAPGLPAGSTFRMFQAVRHARDGVVVVCDLNIPSAPGHQVLLAVDAAGAQSVVAQTGDVLPGLPGPLTSLADGVDEFDVDRSGAVTYTAAAGAVAAVVVDGTVVLRTGDPLPPQGLAFTAVRAVAHNEAGRWAAVVALADPTGGSLGALVVDGQVVALEGDPAPGGGALTFVDWRVDVTDHGDVLWRATTDGPPDQNEVLVLGQRPLVAEGTTTINGRLLTALGRAAIAADGRTLLFTGGFGPTATTTDALLRAALPPALTRASEREAHARIARRR